MKRILFDLLCAQPATVGKFHGGGEYVKTVFEKLATEFYDRCQLAVFFNPELFLDKWIKELLDEKNIVQYSVKSVSDVEEILHKEHYDTVYFGITGKIQPKNIPERVKKVATIHGLRDVEKPTDWKILCYGQGFFNITKCLIKLMFLKKFRQRKIDEMRHRLEYYDHVITVSHHSQYAFKILILSGKEVHMFYTPFKHEEEIQPQIEEEIQKRFGNYILMISGNRWEKNPYRAVEALNELAEKSLLPVNVVIVGKLTERISKKIKNNIVFFNLDYVDPHVLEALYKHCSLFLYPSLNEGFGMPPLEAMKYGRTCAISCICSLPEIYRDAVYYFNPYDRYEIENRILQALDNPINVEKVMERYYDVRRMQNESLEGICSFLIDV